MSELKGIDVIDSAINKWLADNEFDCIATMGPEFAYYHSDSLIHYALWFDKETEPWFVEVMDECGLNYNCDSFILGFFHELGHNMTMDFLDDEDYEYSLAEITRIEDEGADGREDNMTYFHLPLEIEATQWAVDYINNHSDKVAEFWDAVKDCIHNFYKINMVEI